LCKRKTQAKTMTNGYKRISNRKFSSSFHEFLWLKKIFFICRPQIPSRIKTIPVGCQLELIL
jgi:hypothetical protein